MPAEQESILVAALYLDMPNPLDLTDEELDKCVKLLKDQRKYVRVYWESMSDLKSLFLTGEVNRAWSWEPVVRMVNDEDPKFNLVFPFTTSPTGGKGCLGGFEGFGMSVDQDEEHEEASYQFLNYTCGDDYFYRVFKELGYRPVTQAVVDRMTPEEVLDRGLDDPEGLLDSMFMWALTPRQDLYNQKMNEIKAG
jgi:spermidine/putrescine-binding protein